MTRGCERGLSLVELMVGAAIGLIVVAAAGSVVTAHQAASRHVQLEARLMQDLRSAAELVGRDLRRAGHWGAAASGVRQGDEPGAVNPHVAIAPASGPAGVVALSFATGAGDPLAIDDAERFGFRVRNGAIEVQLGDRNWQALSDPGTVVVTAFEVVPRVDETDLATFCARPCAAGSTTCPPRQQIRSYEIAVAGRSATDPLVRRELRSTVRVRNDVVVGSCEA
ncbi:MAG: prepilin-type N-terminal cleavage/methylation domain-containing protein [Caldimonas sp.]